MATLGFTVKIVSAEFSFEAACANRKAVNRVLEGVVEDCEKRGIDMSAVEMHVTRHYPLRDMVVSRYLADHWIAQ